MDERVRSHVRARAGEQCEYCQVAEARSPVARLQLEHVVPRKHGGSDEMDNLALACIDCNLRKGPNLTGIDSHTGQIVPLFNPRSQQWSNHYFAWDGLRVIGLTDVGRTTVRVPDMNSDDRLMVRAATEH